VFATRNVRVGDVSREPVSLFLSFSNKTGRLSAGYKNDVLENVYVF